MEKQIYDEKNGLWYELYGDYYLPCLTLPTQKDKPIGIWGQRHLRYIKQHKRAFYTSLLTSGKLNSYLADINTLAGSMFDTLLEVYKQKYEITEELKSTNQMEWVQKMNSIREMIREVIFNDIVYK